MALKRTGFSNESKRKSREKALAKQKATPRKPLKKKRTVPKQRGRDENGNAHDIIKQAEVDAHRRFKLAAKHQPCCARCGGRGPFDPHHVVEKQWLKANHLPLWDVENCLRLCVGCHAKHTQPGPRDSNRLKLGCLRDENILYAFKVMGAAAPGYLRRKYRGRDRRIEQLELEYG